jgi:hypothetical protein
MATTTMSYIEVKEQAFMNLQIISPIMAKLGSIKIDIGTTSSVGAFYLFAVKNL